MSNLDRAFLKAYSKQPVASQPSTPTAAVIQKTTGEVRPPKSNTAAVLSRDEQVATTERTSPRLQRTASRSMSTQPSSAVASRIVHRANKSDGSYFRLDEVSKPADAPVAAKKHEQTSKPVQPVAPKSQAVAPSTPASPQPVAQKKIDGLQSLAKYKAEVRQQTEAAAKIASPIKPPQAASMSAVSPASLRGKHFIHPAELATPNAPQHRSENPFYTYPNQSTDQQLASPLQAQATTANESLDKATLRKMAAASANHAPSSAVQSTKNDSVFRTFHEPHTSQPSRQFEPWNDTRSAPPEASTSANFERSVKATTNHFSQNNIAAKTNSQPSSEAVRDPLKQPLNNSPKQTKAGATTQKHWQSDDRQHRLDTAQSELHLPRNAELQSAATVKVAQDLADQHLNPPTNPPSPKPKDQSRSHVDEPPVAEQEAVAKPSEPLQKSREHIDAKLAAAAQSFAVPIQAAWEVDHFQWPGTVLDLLEAQEEAFFEISDHLQDAHRKGLRTIAITSAERGVGKSTTTLCLAAVMAHAGLKVAVIDGDVEHPSLVNHLNLELEHGWQDCIFDNLPLEEVAIHAIEEQITLFPLTTSLHSDDIQQYHDRINKLIKRISNAFDLVIIDCQRLNQHSSPPIGTGHEGVLDAAMVVIDAELSIRDRIEATLQLLQEYDVNSIGVVENFNSQAVAA